MTQETSRDTMKKEWISFPASDFLDVRMIIQKVADQLKTWQYAHVKVEVYGNLVYFWSELDDVYETIVQVAKQADAQR